ncbi:40S ribosomal protein S4, X isoform [Saguinus oedipus]|uniref:40S ribosomal protein S4, X isoform n=1 Tax=Saguinus oedipus TaxID=9490 RepID=A0ABQ9W4V5_SAGOE|nr:40S ribosomal protein S4, X isoform [Saguinus oedipus]
MVPAHCPPPTPQGGVDPGTGGDCHIPVGGGPESTSQAATPSATGTKSSAREGWRPQALLGRYPVSTPTAQGRAVAQPQGESGMRDVISIDKTGENFRLIRDTEGCSAVHRITPEEAKYKLKIFVDTKGIPHLVTQDARIIRYPDPLIKKITDFIKFTTGNLCMVTGGATLGRTGVITTRERHPGSFDVVHVKDANGSSSATQLSNIFVTGKGNKPWISLPRGKGIRLTIVKGRDKRLAAKQSSR